MESGKEIKAAVSELLELAAVSANEADRFCIVFAGGSDDIVGMGVTLDQFLQGWSNLDGLGARVYRLLLDHARDDPRAHGAFCYSPDTIEGIIRNAKAIRLAA